VDADAVGVHGEPPGELVGRGRAADLTQQGEQPPAGRLDEEVVPLGLGKVDTGQFSHLTGRIPKDHGTLPALAGEERYVTLRTLWIEPWP
jgi:hypothetical protein